MAAVDDEYLHKVSSNLINNNYQQNIKWIPLSLTHVEYPQGDSLGHLLSLISLMPFAIIIGFLTLILFRRDLHTICFFIGVVVTDIIGLSLKYTIREARPMRRDVIYVEYGMPSSHSLLMWFFATYTALFVCLRMHQNNNSTVVEKLWRWTIIGGCTTVAILVSYSRIYLQYHTISQVLCGFIVGVIMGITWFFITHLVLAPFFPIIVSWRLSEFLLIRDTTLIPNVLWFEYTNIRTEARARSRKLVSMKSQ
ncbi:dolichyldiphosphatase 1-like [Microplitis demolitor]|uniref:dolichyldiphosphatase 1-like n=1 Tax=Microplitis demolitor TaxID=69319 RepID=UPI0004CCD828|nr:dolichyldiphosphatase 1-like [Microplitis demolitor]